MGLEFYQLLAVAIISVAMIALGVCGIKNRGRNLQTPRLGKIDVIFSWGQLGCGLIGVLFLVVWFLR